MYQIKLPVNVWIGQQNGWKLLTLYLFRDYFVSDLALLEDRVAPHHTIKQQSYISYITVLTQGGMNIGASYPIWFMLCSIQVFLITS